MSDTLPPAVQNMLEAAASNNHSSGDPLYDHIADSGATWLGWADGFSNGSGTGKLDKLQENLENTLVGAASVGVTNTRGANYARTFINRVEGLDYSFARDRNSLVNKLNEMEQLKSQIDALDFKELEDYINKEGLALNHPDLAGQLPSLGLVKSYIRGCSENLNLQIEWIKEYERLEDEAAKKAAAHLERAKSRTRGMGDAQLDEVIARAEARKKNQLASVRSAIAGALEQSVTTAFREQCFLQRYSYDLIKNRIDYLDEETELPYEEGLDQGLNHPLDVQGRPFGFLNLLVTPVSTRALFELSPAVLSQLQPYIRLYKVDENNIETPVTFDSSSKKLASAMRNSKKRGSGVGLKSFNFAYEGTDPFSVKKSISAKLEIFAASFSELLEPRPSVIRLDGQKPEDAKRVYYSYTDLALKTGTSLSTQKIKSGINSTGVIDNLNKLKFRLKAVVGYSLPKNLHIPNADAYDRDMVQKAVYNSFTTLNLTPTTHEFKFDESGRVNFTINYLAYIEDFFDMAYFNIFSDIRTTSNVYKRKTLRKWFESTCDTGEIDALKNKEEKLIPQDQRNAFRSLVEKLFSRDKVFVMEVSYNKMGDFVLNPLNDPASLITAQKTTPKSVKELAKNAASPGPDTASQPKKGSAVPVNSTKTDPSKNEQIAFFYFHDLIDVAMLNIEESLSETGYIEVLNKLERPDDKFIDREKEILVKMRDNYKQLRVILGPIEIRNPADSSSYMAASLGDIPISLKYFAEWMTQKVIARGRVEYNLSRFINDFVKHYLRSFLNDTTCYGGASSQKVIFQSSNITSFKAAGDDHDEITSRIVKDRESFGPENLGRLNMQDETGMTVFNDCLLNVMGKRDLPTSQLSFDQQFNYMIFYAGRSAPKEYGLHEGIKTNDEDAGIFHYVLGRDQGIIKNIQLKRTDAPGLKELRFEQEGYDGLMQLREVYDVNISAFSYPNAYPGTYIFVDPRGFDPNSAAFGESRINDLSNLGIGGYYYIVRSDHTFREGEASTNITAKWVHEINKEDEEEPPEDNAQIDSSKSTLPKCKTRASQQNTSVIPSQEGSQGSNDTVGKK